MAKKRIINALGLLIILFMAFSLKASAAATPQKSFIYRVKITDVNDPITFSNISNNLKSLFDSEVRFNDYTDEIIIHSDFDITQEKLGEDLTSLGYVLKSYRQAFITTNHDY